MPKQRVIRRKKRRFASNQFTKSPGNKPENDVTDEPRVGSSNSIDSPKDDRHLPSVSSRKLLSSSDVDEKKSSKTVEYPEHSKGSSITGFRLVDMAILNDTISSLRCAECGNFTLTLIENSFKRKGCASYLRILCENCGWKKEDYSSKKQTQCFEVNRRLVYAMRSLGKGHSGAKKFCTLMNMPPPSGAKPFAKSSHTIVKHVKNIAKKSMANAASEIRNTQNAGENDIVNCPVSCDGTWQKRGYSSQNGCVAVISVDTGKVLDAEALTQACKQCQLHAHLDKDSVEYHLWRADHNNCKANFKGSAPAMEPEGTERIFRRSITTHNLRYTELYGDGDSKSHKQVKNVYSEDGIEVTKKECIGHVQKRVGTALRKLKKENPGFAGRGRLTDAMIDKMQNYYGIAIRSNVGDLRGMKKAVHATLFHCASNDARPLHDHCPPGPGSWCGYQRNRATYKHGPGLPLDVIAKVKPVYQRLSDDALLEKCLHGKTQNQNESLNGMVWQRIPKEVFVGKETLEFGLYDAIAHFNMGAKTVLLVYEALGIPTGLYTQRGCQYLDSERIYKAHYKDQHESKKRRKVLRGKKKRKEDKKQQSEGVTYARGQF